MVIHGRVAEDEKEKETLIAGLAFVVAFLGTVAYQLGKWQNRRR